jgi:hypothetical protein
MLPGDAGTEIAGAVTGKVILPRFPRRVQSISPHRRVAMPPGLHALLEGAIDYAGTFPPARLSLEEAVRNYARYRQEPEQWMLGRFIYPAARLRELDAYADLFREGRPFCFSVVGRGGSDEEGWITGIQADLDAAEAFRQRHQPRVVTDVYETKLPARLGPPSSWKDLIRAGLRLLDRWTGGVTAFFEHDLGPEWRSSLPLVLAAIAEAASTGGRRAGFKLRCGGLEAKAFPSVEQVAFVLCACRDAGVPLKCTAGLHHPIRRFDAGVGTHMHGFINVLLAGILAQARRLDEEQLRLVVADESAAHFVCDGQGCRWRDWRAATEEVRAARQTGVLSFGSCSFDEPRDDLRFLGWL